MAAKILIEEQAKSGGWECRVTVAEGGSKTIHTVTVEKSYRDKLAGAGISAGQLVRNFVQAVPHARSRQVGQVNAWHQCAARPKGCCRWAGSDTDAAADTQV